MPKLLRSSETAGCGATIELDNKDVVFVSIAQTSVLVRLINIRGGYLKILVSNFFGPALYNQSDVYKNSQTARALSIMFPEQIPVLSFNNPVLAAFSNAMWHCSSAAEVCVVLNEAMTKAPLSDDDAEDAALQAAFDAAKNWEPDNAQKAGLQTYQVVFSDGVRREIQHSPKKVAGWALECNSGKYPYRVVRILDATGKIVWGQ